MFILSTINSVILFVLSVIHFNWVVGGSWGFANALPTNLEGKRMLNPKKLDSAIVAIGLLSFAFFFLIYGGILEVSLPNWLLSYGIWIISGIFLLRAVGDFKYVGFFKRIRTTDFGRLDARYYSPLCLLISVIGFLMIFANKILPNH